MVSSLVDAASATPPSIPHRESTGYAYARVREAILSGEIAAGSEMSQVTLAHALGVSRTPLREALRMLQAERLVEAEPNRRVRVSELTAVDLEALSVVRVTLEAEAVRLAVPHMTPELLAEMEGSIAQMAHFAQAGDYARWAVPHSRFHRTLTRPAGTYLNELLAQHSDFAERYRQIHVGRGPGAFATADHRRILDACEAADRGSAAIALASHLTRHALEVIAILDPGYQPDQLHAALSDVRGPKNPPRAS